jgi:di/tricarboxylate transporter
LVSLPRNHREAVDVVGFEALAVLLVLLVAIVTLAREMAPPPAVMLGAVVALVLVGVLDPEQAFAGLSNAATLTIAGLFIVARAVRDHARIDRVVEWVLGGRNRPSSARGALVRMPAPVLLMSSVLNNIPLVATLAPVVRSWAERHGVATTHLLMPLSFAAILGGLLTTIGTSTNLVVSGILGSSTGTGFGFFEVTWVGLPLALLAVTVMMLLAPRVLPDRRSPHEQVAGHERDFAVRLQVADDGPVAHHTVEDAGLRDLRATYLASVTREGYEIAPVTPSTLLLPEDVLSFVGRVDDVRDLLSRPGLIEAEHPQTALLDGDGHELYECVLGSSSPLVGRTLKEVSFRGRYGGAVVAIHRAGTRVDAKLGTVRLHAGDVLLVLADRPFGERWQGTQDFAVVVPHRTRTATRSGREPLVVGTVLAMVALSASGLVEIVTAVMAAVAVLVGTRTIRFRRALESLNFDVLLIVAAAIGLGVAMEVSGLAGIVAGGVELASTRGGLLLALAMVVVGTLVLTELITNVAAAGIMVPIALDAAARVGADPTGFAVAVAIAASASFLTPIGYQTNTIVYGLGGYRFGDYWKLGLPLTLAVVLATLVVVPVVWG